MNTATLHRDVMQENISVRNRAMLASLHIHQWSARKYDAAATGEVARNHQAERRAGRYNKMLIDAEQYLKPIAQTAAKMRDTHYSLTLPWFDKGDRILTLKHYETYCAEMNEARDTFTRQVSEFLAVYPDAKEAARRYLGTLYNEADYPGPEQIADRFACDYYMTPLPDAEDFRVDIDPADIDRAAERIDQAIQEAQRDAWRRMFEAVKAVAQRMEAINTGDSKYFKEGLFESLVRQAEVTPGLNLHEDEALDRLAAEAHQVLTGYDIDTLRRSERARTETAKAARDIMHRMKFQMLVQPS